jgi:hypothetical protein
MANGSAVGAWASWFERSQRLFKSTMCASVCAQSAIYGFHSNLGKSSRAADSIEKLKPVHA